MNKDCIEIQKAMDELFDESLSDARADELLAHIDGCPECARQWELLGRLRAGAAAEPSDAEMLAMRRGVIRRIRASEGSGAGWLERLRAALMVPAFGVAIAAFFVVGAFVAGRATRQQVPVRELPVASGGDAIVDEIQLVASRNRQLSDVENSPFSYDNVEVEDAGGGKLALRFDVSRHVDVVLPKTDPLVADVLAQSLLEKSSVGMKLRAISYSEPVMSPKVREALAKAMLEDENLGVRMKAQEMLVQTSGEAAIEAALLGVLEKEESVQMRLVAIDYLTRGNVAPDRLRDAVTPRDSGTEVDAVYVRAMDYVNSK
ncbi:MAG: zf-HC2 domain-containing protein [Thermoanaerobaculia bacterium]|nr:zf-HC2 domain-containing protein [Thermoanaerobaculia bacterium]